MIHHRAPDFQALLERTVSRLQQVCRTEHDVLLFTASGTGAFESAVANLVSPGDSVLAVSHGNLVAVHLTGTAPVRASATPAVEATLYPSGHDAVVGALLLARWIQQPLDSLRATRSSSSGRASVR